MPEPCSRGCGAMFFRVRTRLSHEIKCMPRARAHFDAEIVPPQPRKRSSHPLYEHIDDNKEQTSDDYFPFKSWTMMELAAWRMYFEVSRPALDALLSIVSD